MKRQCARAARSACDSRGCPVRLAARAALRSWAHRRTAGAVAVADAGAVAPAALVVTAAFGAPAAFRVASSRAAWLAGAAPPPWAAAPPPVPAVPLPPGPVLAAGAADRFVPARDIPAITPPPASRAARATHGRGPGRRAARQGRARAARWAGGRRDRHQRAG